MSDAWNESENLAAVKAYLWMLKVRKSGRKPIKARVREALILGPLKQRSEGSIEYRFQNISFVLQSQGENWLDGYLPAKNVGAKVAKTIREQIVFCRNNKERRRVDWLIAAIPEETLTTAARELVNGKSHDFPDSKDYDVEYSRTKIPPKQLISYAAQLHYGAPLLPADFVGGIGSRCFALIEKTGLRISERQEEIVDTNSAAFRALVTRRRREATGKVPMGNAEPCRSAKTSYVYERDAAVVAHVERRAEGKCELCGNPAPFNRKDGTPYLEVHHIQPLSEDGKDTVHNAAAICPNCHRECHFGTNKEALHHRLLKIVAERQRALAV